MHKRTTITAESERRHRTLKAMFVFVVTLGTAYLLGHYGNTAVAVMSSFGTASIGFFIAVLIMTRRPKRLVPRATKHLADKSERKFVRKVKRTWLSVCCDSGLSREERDLGRVTVHVPRVISIDSVPLGVKLLVQTIPGQPVEEVVNRADHLASALGVWLRSEVKGPATVEFISELHEPLQGIRRAGTSLSTKITIGRCDDGTDAEIDIVEASHIAIQGMTRSGKSALCYTIFGQLIGTDVIRVTGVDPNRVLLEPLAQSDGTYDTDFVLGADPVSALDLLDKTCLLMDDRAHLLTQWGIAAHENFHEDFPVHVVLLEEYAGLLRQAAAHDEGVKPTERIAPKIKQRVGRLVSEGAKAGIRVVLITQRMDASTVDGDSRGQFGTRITMAVDNGDAVRMLHPQVDPETIERVVGFPVGRCLFWRNRTQKFMQADFMPYEEYRTRLGLKSTLDADAFVD